MRGPGSVGKQVAQATEKKPPTRGRVARLSTAE